MNTLDRSDPWWAFLWPGSQALSRSVLLFYAHKIFNLR
jgi:predicted nicotinamide N-methyase